VLELPALVEALAPVRIGHARVVLTNGVFDLLHVGHLRFLRAARALGDLLVVGINADSSVGKPGRPIVPDVERAELVAALEPVDFVVIFSELTADDLLRALRPSVYVKGADYTIDTLPEAATARMLGVEIQFVPLVEGHSSSALIEASGAGRRVLTVYAHPDDESFGPAAVCARLVSEGAQLHGLWFTSGEHGAPVQDPPPPNLGQLRAAALVHEVARVIGYHESTLLSFEDGTLENHVADAEQIILFHLRRVRPSIVFTFGPAGITRHPDHVAVHRATLAAFHTGREEGIPLRELYFDAVPPKVARDMDLANQHDGNPNTFVDVTDFQHVKRDALAIHARYVADAVERLERLQREPMPVEPLYRAWPAVPEGTQLRTIAV